MKMQLSSDKLYICFLVARLASSIPLASTPPLPFPADEDISNCQFTPTTKSPTQRWHDASFDPTDDNDNAGGAGLANQSLPLLPSSHQALAPAPIVVTRKRDAQITAASNTTTTVICTTIAAFTFHNLHISPPLNNYRTRPPLTLGPGRYVLSFTNSKPVRLIGVDAVIGGHSTISTHTFDNTSGTVAFSLMRTAEVAFLFVWADPALPAIEYWVTSGEVAVFRIGPG